MSAAALYRAARSYCTKYKIKKPPRNIPRRFLLFYSGDETIAYFAAAVDAVAAVEAAEEAGSTNIDDL